MAEPSRFDRLEQAIHAAPGGRPDPDIAPLAALAADLRHLPRPDFKETLRKELVTRAMTAAAPGVKPIPEGYHTATPYLIVSDAAGAIEFYQRAFGAAELFRVPQPDGRIGHAEIRIGDSRIMLADEHPEIGARGPGHYGGSPVMILLYVEDVDATFAQAVAAGATVERPLADQPYGDRNGGLVDPFGHRWFVATHVRDVAPPPREQPQPRPGRTVTPYIQVEGAARLIDFMKEVLGAEETMRVPAPDGKIMHAAVTIGNSLVELADAVAPYPAAPTALHVYVEDVDAVYERALRAGASSLRPPGDQDYGERAASVRDPLGNHWYFGKRLPGALPPRDASTLYLCLLPQSSPRLIAFLQRAFGAEELFRAQAPDGAVHYAQIRIGDSVIELGDAHGPYQPMPSAIHLHVPDCEAVFRQALAAGAAELFPLKDAPYGERVGGVTDPFGHVWYIATVE